MNLKSECDLWHLMVKEMWAGKTLADDHKVRSPARSLELGESVGSQVTAAAVPETPSKALLPSSHPLTSGGGGSPGPAGRSSPLPQA